MRKTPPDQTIYLLRDIPRELWTQVHAKANGLRPKVPIRRVILALLEEWASRPETSGKTTIPISVGKPTNYDPPMF